MDGIFAFATITARLIRWARQSANAKNYIVCVVSVVFEDVAHRVGLARRSHEWALSTIIHLSVCVDEHFFLGDLVAFEIS